MYCLGYCDHFLSLKRKHPSLFDRAGEWTLKEYGALFAYDVITGANARRVLEIGPGYNKFFATHMAKLGVEYWYCDKGTSGLGIGPDSARWDHVTKEREALGAMLIPCLMGDGDARLPDASFDCVFSVSVIEHIPDEDMPAVARDVRRVLKKGGLSSHSIDIYPKSKKAQLWHAAAEEAAIEVPQPHYLTWEFDGPQATLLESQRVRYFSYNALTHKDPLAEGMRYYSHFATILHQGIAL